MLININHNNISGKVEHLYYDAILKCFSNNNMGERIKENKGRNVWRSSVENGISLYIKKFKHSGTLQRLRFLFAKSKAEQEFETLNYLSKNGVNVPTPVGFAVQNNTKESYVITQEIPDTIPLNEYLLQNNIDHHTKRKLLNNLAVFIYKVYLSGLVNPDMHAGNILIRTNGGGISLFLIDVHRTFITSNLDTAYKLKSLAFFIHSIYQKFSTADIVRFIRYYLQLTDIPETKYRTVITYIFRSFRDIRYRHWKSRSSRCIRRGSGFDILKMQDGSQLFIRKNIDPNAIIDAIKTLSITKPLKELTNRSISLHNGFSVKRYLNNIASILKSRGRSAWYNANAVAVRGIATPNVYALYEDSKDSFIVGEWLSNATPFNDYLKSKLTVLPFSEKCKLIRHFALFVRQLHNRGVFHKDLKANNILATNNPANLQLIDLDSVKFYRELPLDKMIKNLAQLNAAITPPLTLTDRLRFYRYYAGRDIGLIKEKRTIINKIMGITRARKHLWP